MARPAAGALRSDVVVIPGGGTGHPHAQDAARQFLTAARNLAIAGFATTFVGSTQESLPRLTCIAALPQADLAALMRGARLVIANGGSTLLQAIACGAAVVAAPIAGDQGERIRACAALRVAVEAAPHAGDLKAKAQKLLEDEPARAALSARAAALELADGIDIALDALASLGRRA